MLNLKEDNMSSQKNKLNKRGEGISLIRDKRGDLESLIKIISWIAFFVIALGALYFLIKRFTG